MDGFDEFDEEQLIIAAREFAKIAKLETGDPRKNFLLMRDYCLSLLAKKRGGRVIWIGKDD